MGKKIIANGLPYEVAEVTNAESSLNKTTTLTSASTDTEYPTAKATYDAIQAGSGEYKSYVHCGMLYRTNLCTATIYYISKKSTFNNSVGQLVDDLANSGYTIKSGETTFHLMVSGEFKVGSNHYNIVYAHFNPTTKQLALVGRDTSLSWAGFVSFEFTAQTEREYFENAVYEIK